jgi:2-oxo-4-hydroxy-4-carboxy-5-ureidoimidazoline decarboxylase
VQPAPGANCGNPWRLFRRLSGVGGFPIVRAFMPKLTIAALNALDASRFTESVGRVYEHAPWIAERAAGLRPFKNREALHAAMKTAMRKASADEKLALIRGHPDLAGKAAIAGDLTAESKSEQGGAGLDRLTPGQFAAFQAMNGAYWKKFGFPFIVAVKGLNAASILEDFARRFENDRETEIETALKQIERISGFRLADLVED